MWREPHRCAWPAPWRSSSPCTDRSRGRSRPPSHDAGEIVGQEIRDIVSSYENDFWPEEGGTIFPNNMCTYCPMLGICSDDPKLVEEKLIRLGAPVGKKEDWLDRI